MGAEPVAEEGTRFVPRRGRPAGSEIDESRELAMMAALLAAGEETTLAGAIRRVKDDHPSTVRRLSRKFAARREELMAAHDAAALAARERARGARRVAVNGLLALGGFAFLLTMLLSFAVSPVLALPGIVAVALAASAVHVAAARLLPPPADDRNSRPRREQPSLAVRIGGRTVRIGLGGALGWGGTLAAAGLCVPLWGRDPAVDLVAAAMLGALVLGQLGSVFLARAADERRPDRAAAYGTAAGLFMLVGLACLPLAATVLGLAQADARSRLDAALPVLEAADRVAARLPATEREEVRRTVLAPALRAVTEQAEGLGGWTGSVRAVVSGAAGEEAARALGRASLLVGGGPKAVGGR